MHEFRTKFLFLGLICGSLLLVLFLAEASLRYYNWGTIFSTLRGRTILYDADLGWKPRPGAYQIQGTTVTVSEESFRKNGSSHVSSSLRPILAVGDSFTFGNEVSDDETWPSLLGTSLSRQVINGGVGGYGVDQIYLRAKQIVPTHRPEIVIFSFVPFDLERAERSVFLSRAKPYFSVSGNTLKLLNTPVPTSDDHSHIVGHWRSFLMNLNLATLVLKVVAPESVEELRSIRVHSEGVKVSCLLLKELNEWLSSFDSKLLILSQMPYDLQGSSEVGEVVKCSQALGLNVVQSLPLLQKIKANDPSRYDTLFVKKGHMSKLGNHLIASLVVEGTLGKNTTAHNLTP